MAELFLIYARAANGTIGVDNRLPWHLPADLKHFKALTLGKPMIMGRKTFESFPSPLPGRRHIVLTRDTGWARAGAEVAHSVEDALALAGAGEVAVVGGAEIYALFMDRASRVELTEVDLTVEGDTHMPPLGAQWHEVSRETHAPEGSRPGFAFVTLTRDL
ncbi:dihydrofolate reductase [Novosphingobium rosa]|uniref:dihydrofolate reductase n=1 Tax=Novosphingobium rosa TaxID=76978 RepID=UPI000832229A|nr:dihydrofolate reductase [Novosphingobium rosa]